MMGPGVITGVTLHCADPPENVNNPCLWGPERWLSGRKRGFAKSVTGQLVRRFESCPLRFGLLPVALSR